MLQVHLTYVLIIAGVFTGCKMNKAGTIQAAVIAICWPFFIGLIIGLKMFERPKV